MSISKITKDLKCSVIFHYTHCVFQELALGRTIGNAKEQDGLYLLEEGTNLNKEGRGLLACKSFLFLVIMRCIYCILD